MASVEMFRGGISESEIARRLGVTPQAVHGWHVLFKRGGEEALRKRRRTGRPSSLTPAERKRLAVILVAGAVRAGYSTDLWTTERVADVVKRRFEVDYTTVGVWKLLRSMGFSWQRPKRQAKERDERVIRDWLVNTWPRLQKKGEGEERS